MKKLMTYLRRIAVIALVLWGVNYFFAHLAFNRMMNEIATQAVAKEAAITLTSYASLLPRPAIHVSELEYKGKDKAYVSLRRFEGEFDFSQFVRNKKLLFTKVEAEGGVLNLPDILFKEFIGLLLFQLSVADKSQAPNQHLEQLSQLSLKNVMLGRVVNDHTVRYTLKHITYQQAPVKKLILCFNTENAAHEFNTDLLASFNLKPKVEAACLVF